uniref:GG11191 n=1 Tax=Drosophila erecta TaxID=7220 RepID=B3P7F6_DROER
MDTNRDRGESLTLMQISSPGRPSSQLPAKLGHHLHIHRYARQFALQCAPSQCFSAQAQAREIATQDQKAEEGDGGGGGRNGKDGRQQEPMEPRSSPV